MRDWYFTFGDTGKFAGFYVKIHGTFTSARDEMVRRFGDKWRFQLTSADDSIVNGMRELKQ